MSKCLFFVTFLILLVSCKKDDVVDESVKNPDELSCELYCNQRTFKIGTVLYDAAESADNTYYFYEKVNAKATDTPLLTIRVVETVVVDGSSNGLERVNSVTLSDGTRLDEGATGTFSILREEATITFKVDGETSNSKPFYLRYEGAYSVWFPPARVLDNEFSLSGRNPSKIFRVLAERGREGSVKLFFYRETPKPSMASGYDVVEVQVPNTIWNGEIVQISETKNWHIRHGNALDPIRGYLFTQKGEEGVSGTVRLLRDGDDIEIELDVEMTDREEKYNPNLEHPRMQVKYKGAVEGDIYGLSNQVAVNQDFYSIGSVLMDKSNETLYQIYLCEEAGLKDFEEVKNTRYMKFVIPLSKLQGADPLGISLPASDCSAIEVNGTPLIGVTGTIKVTPEQRGVIGFAADVTSEGVRYQTSYIGEYKAPGFGIEVQFDAEYVYYYSSNGQTVLMASKEATSYELLKDHPYFVLTVSDEMVNSSVDNLGDAGNFSFVYYENGDKLISISSDNLDGVSGILQIMQDMTLNIVVNDALGNILRCQYFNFDGWTQVPAPQ